MNMNIVFSPSPFPISISFTTMHSSTKVTSTYKSSTTSMAKTIGTNKDTIETMKKKNKWIIEQSDEEDEEEKREEKNTNNMENDSKVNKIKQEIRNINRFLAGSGNYRSKFLPMLY